MNGKSQKGFDFSPKKRALLDKLIRREELGLVESNAIPRRSNPQTAPLSLAQRQLWFIHELYPESPSYHNIFVLQLIGAVNLPVIQQGVDELVRRHEALRTTFRLRNQERIQSIAPSLEVTVHLIDLSALSGVDASDVALRLAVTDARKCFDLERGPLLRMTLVRLSPRESRLFFTIHHIVSDGWSLEILRKEFMRHYGAFSVGAPSELTAPLIEYGDFAIWQKKWVDETIRASHLPIWKEKLAGAAPTLDLPLDRPRPQSQSFNGSRLPLRIPVELIRKLKMFCRRHNTTNFIVLLAAFKALLNRYTGRKDVIVGSPTAGRNRVDIESVVGLFTNMLVLRTELSSDLSFQELLASVRATVTSALTHQDLPFGVLVEELNPERDLSHTPLFQIVFSFQEDPRGLHRAPGLVVKQMEVDARTAKFDLVLDFRNTGEELVATLEYDADLFEETTIRRMAGHFLNLLAGGLASPEQRLWELPLLSNEERENLAPSRTPPASDRRYDRLAHTLFEDHADRTPDAVALVYGEEWITYCELNRRANQLARHLSTLGVGREAVVGLLVGRSIEMLIGMLGALKAGASYAPLDPSDPESRLSFILEDAGITVLLTRREYAHIFSSYTGEVVCLDSDWNIVAEQCAENIACETDQSNLAYVIYTSGSTGKPKGVQIEHRSLLNLILWHQRRFGITATDRATQLAATGFDASVWEVWPYLTTGSSLYLVDQEVRLSPELLQRWLIEAGITRTFLPTPLAESMLEMDWSRNFTLKTLLTGGDTLHKYNQPSNGFDLINNYGPTENTVVATSALIGAEQSERKAPPIGRPIDNVQAYILDDWLSLAPLGVIGELYIAGEGVARGYVKRADMTAERFTPDHFSLRPGASMYRTGDISRCSATGQLEFLGRADNQIKLRGRRIEIEEIEAILSEHENVKQAAVDVINTASGKCLVAYISAGPVSKSDLAIYIRRRLPEYMAPTAYVFLDSLPVKTNGKIDRASLDQYYSAEIRDTAQQPKNPIEELLGEIWKEALGVENVGTTENFFELGGHSLLAAQVASRVREGFGVELGVRAIFEEPTVAGLARRIMSLGSVIPYQPPPLTPVPRNGDLPLSFAQQRLWFLDRLEQSAAYNISCGIRLKGVIEVGILERSLSEIERRHEILRTTIITVDGQPRQVIGEPRGIKVDLTDLRGESPDKKEETARALSRNEAEGRFDLAQGPLLRARLLRWADDEHILLLTMHHIISDGWSFGVLGREIEAVYESAIRGEKCPLPDLSLQYADYACWERQWLQGQALKDQLEYWRNNLSGELPVLSLPADRPRTNTLGLSGGVKYWSIPAESVKQVRLVGIQEGATPFMVVLAVFKDLLYRYSGQDEILIGVPTAGRNRDEVQSLIGFFANTLALRTELGGDPTFSELVRRVREVTLRAYANQDAPFEMVVEAVQPARSLSHAPLFQVMMAWQSGPEIKINLKGVESEIYPVETGAAKFELVLMISPVAGGIKVGLEYSSERFDAVTIERMSDHFNQLLEAAVGDPKRNLSELPFLSKAEYEELMGWNETQRPYPKDQTMALLFEEQVWKTPDRTAVMCGEEALSYGELDRSANQLARFLLRLGVGPESPVGVCAERNLEMIIALFGTLKAGGAYVGLDPAYPLDRLAFMVSDANIKVILTQQRLMDRLPATGTVCCLDRDRQMIAELSAEPVVNRVRQDNLVYLIYTSGSTGLPKGVAITHRNAVAFIHWAAGMFGNEQIAGTLASTSVCFDLSVFEIFAPLTRGGAAILMENALELSSSINAHAVTLVNTVPSAMAELLRTGVPSSVQTVNLAGEPLPNSLVQRVYRESNVACVWNLYGPSETTTYSTYAPARSGASEEPSIGRPIANTQVFLLDKHLQLAPAGVLGGIYIAGHGVARSYFERPELTSVRFIPNPLGRLPGDRLYVTGDQGRYRGGGEIEYCGRMDQQVKIRGFRIEIGEIETQLRDYVRDCAVAPIEDGSGGKRLIAFVVPREGKEIDRSQLRRALGRKLPDYMIPSDFILLDELPLTPNGKVDRKALRLMKRSSPDLNAVFVPPSAPTEAAVAAAYADVLGVSQVGVHDDFFGLGGHSLTATRVMARIESAFQVKLALRHIFEAPTVGELAAIIDREREAQAGASLGAIRPRRRGAKNLDQSVCRCRRAFEQ